MEEDLKAAARMGHALRLASFYEEVPLLDFDITEEVNRFPKNFMDDKRPACLRDLRQKYT